MSVWVTELGPRPQLHKYVMVEYWPLMFVVISSQVGLFNQIGTFDANSMDNSSPKKKPCTC